MADTAIANRVRGIDVSGLPDVEGDEGDSPLDPTESLVDADSEPEEGARSDMDPRNVPPLKGAEAVAATDKPAEPPATPDPASIAAKASQWEALEKRFIDAPNLVVKSLIDNLQEHDRTALLRELGVPAEAAAPEEADDDTDLYGTTAEEKLVRQNREWVSKGREEMSQALAQRDDFMNGAAMEIFALRAQLQAVIAHSGLELDAPDYDAAAALVRGGKTYQEAFSPYQQQLVEKAKRRAPRNAALPNTPMDTAGSRPSLAGKKTLAQIMAHVNTFGME